MPNSHWDLVVASAPVHGDSEWVMPGWTTLRLIVHLTGIEGVTIGRPCQILKQDSRNLDTLTVTPAKIPSVLQPDSTDTSLPRHD
jgi:hypothetical protein